MTAVILRLRAVESQKQNLNIKFVENSPKDPLFQILDNSDVLNYPHDFFNSEFNILRYWPKYEAISYLSL